MFSIKNNGEQTCRDNRIEINDTEKAHKKFASIYRKNNEKWQCKMSVKTRDNIRAKKKQKDFDEAK